MGEAFAFAVVVAILIALAIPLLVLATPILIVWAIIRAATRGSHPKHNDASHETRLIQDIHHGLAGMEDRLTNLETILLQRERKNGTADHTRQPRNGG